MTCIRRTVLIAACLVGGAYATRAVAPAYGSDFTNFADDEDACRKVGADAIKGASGPEAAHRYDVAHWRCMAAHGQQRQMDRAEQPPPWFSGRPDNSDFPDAYYAIPYATPGYGYDGFSY